MVALDGALAVGGGASWVVSVDSVPAGGATTPQWNGLKAPLPLGPDAPGTTPPQPGAAIGQLSCLNATFCEAVGSYEDASGNQHATFEQLSNGTWSATEAPAPAGGTDPKFASISCWDVGACVAVGGYKDGTFSRAPMIATLAGGSWSVEAAPLPMGAQTGFKGDVNLLNSVDCPSAGTCIAVGQYKTPMETLGLIDTFAAGSWGAAAAPLPSNAGPSPAASLHDISCPSAQACAAVGHYTDSSGVEQGALLNDSGGSWSATEAPVPLNDASNTSASSVSCVGTTCEAAGQYNDASSGQHGLLEHYSAGTWSAIEAPEPSDAGSGSDQGVTLHSVSCAAGDSCRAVGQYTNSSGNGVALIDSIQSGAPTATVAPLPSDAASTNDGQFMSVSCISADRCVAVGSYGTTSGNSVGLLDYEDTGGWTALSAPVPADAAGASSANSSLVVTACTSDNACVAGGNYVDTAGSQQALLDSFVGQVPSVSSVSPSSGPAAGGTTVTITGSGFLPGAQVNFGSTPADSVTYVSPTELTVVAPTEATGPAGAMTVDVTVTTLGGTSAITPDDHYTFIASNGYWEAARDGGVFAFGSAGFYGSMASVQLNAPIVGMAATPDRRGYWLVAADGGVFSFGDASFHGSAGGQRLGSPVVGIAPTPTGEGYWIVARNGEIFNYGDAPSLGSAANLHLSKPVVGIASSLDGSGYWLAAADGGIFAYGDAGFDGSAGGLALNKPMVALSPTATGKGYWLVAADGGIFTYGDANFYGSTGSMTLNKPVVGMAMPTQGPGYWLVAADGGIFAYGHVPFEGSMGGKTLNQPVVGMAEG